MRTVSLEQFHAELKAQGVPMFDLAFKCVACGTVQSAADLIAAGAGKDFEEVEKYLGFSCVGRWTHGQAPPHRRIEGYQEGCNWTLGGLFGIHTLEVVTPDGERHPRFEPATPEQAQQHASRRAPAPVAMS